MKSILLAGNSEKTLSALKKAISDGMDDVKISTVSRRIEAMVKMGDDSEPVDLLIVSVPLADSDGLELARSTAADGKTGVMLIAGEQACVRLGPGLEDVGVIVLPRPVDRKVFLRAVKDALVMESRLRTLLAERDKLRETVDEIRLVNRAKGVLMNNLGMTEEQAHHYIEKQAMDLRTSRKSVAQSVLQTYYRK